MKNYSLILIAILATTKLYGQNSMFEDASGEAAFKISESQFSLNAAENSIKFSIFKAIEHGGQDSIRIYELNHSIFPESNIMDIERMEFDTLKKTVSNTYIKEGIRIIYGRLGFNNHIGLNVNAVANNGVSQLYNNGEFDPTGEVKLFYRSYGDIRKRNTDLQSRFDYWNFSGGLKAESISLLDTANLISGSQSESSLGYSLEITYNKVGYIKNRKGKKSTIIFGTGVSFDAGDNARNIKSESFALTTTIESIPNQILTQTEEIKGINKDTYKTNIQTLNVNADFGIYPNGFNDQILIATHLRSKKKEGLSLISNFGFGAYIADKDASTRILGGINLYIEDIFRAETELSVDERIAINLVVGFKL